MPRYGQRVVASLTSLPSRIVGLDIVVKSILNQTYRIDNIYLNIPNVTKKGMRYDDNELRRIQATDDRIILNRCYDYGPITKLIPTLYKETNPNTIIITFDDDNYVDPNTVEIFMKKHKKYPEAALSFSGWCIGSFPFYFQLISDNENDVKVDWLQGCHGILYLRKNVDPDDLLQYKHHKNIKELDFNDDHWISSYLTCDKISINYSPLKYFFGLPTGNVDSISGASWKFHRDVATLSFKLKQSNTYQHHHNVFSSVLFIPIIFITLIVISWILSPTLFIFLSILILLIILMCLGIKFQSRKLKLQPYQNHDNTLMCPVLMTTDPMISDSIIQ